mmetsp:Transcript_27668/g.53764  ORF Transcript_27668/g.53764 Transcript_27668/m.53764 type:complete len:224 (-) Transcript_27668:412-1083(-)
MGLLHKPSLELICEVLVHRWFQRVRRTGNHAFKVQFESVVDHLSRRVRLELPQSVLEFGSHRGFLFFLRSSLHVYREFPMLAQENNVVLAQRVVLRFPFPVLFAGLARNGQAFLVEGRKLLVLVGFHAELLDFPAGTCPAAEFRIVALFAVFDFAKLDAQAPSGLGEIFGVDVGLTVMLQCITLVLLAQFFFLLVAPLVHRFAFSFVEVLQIQHVVALLINPR